MYFTPVFPPLLSMIAGICRSLPGRFQWPRRPSLFVCFSALGGYLHDTLSFITVHRFSIELRSGRVLCHSSTYILFLFRNSLATFERWQEAPCYLKIVQPSRCMCSVAIHSGVRRNKIDLQRNGTPWHPKPVGSVDISLWLQHILVKTPIAA